MILEGMVFIQNSIHVIVMNISQITDIKVKLFLLHMTNRKRVKIIAFLILTDHKFYIYLIKIASVLQCTLLSKDIFNLDTMEILYDAKCTQCLLIYTFMLSYGRLHEQFI